MDSPLEGKMDELKPCPFCGSKAVLTHIPPDGTPYRMGDDGLYIVCCYDDECGNGKSGSNLDDVIKEWNRRPLEDALQAEIERLRVTVDAMKTDLIIAFGLIRRAVELLPLDDIGKLEGVRAWQETVHLSDEEAEG